MIRVSFAVQAVRSRASHVELMVDRLRKQLTWASSPSSGRSADHLDPSIGWDPSLVTLVFDDRREGCWPTWARAWGCRPRGVTHHVVLQDDLLLCADLPETMRALARARPNDVISGFLPRKSVDDAVRSRVPWVRTRRFLWAQCVMMPVERGDQCVSWVREHEGSAVSKDWGNSGDMRIAGWLKAFRLPVFVAVPHPVEHIGDALEGGSVMGHHGKPSSRRARPGAWLGEARSLAGESWNNLEFVRE